MEVARHSTSRSTTPRPRSPFNEDSADSFLPPSSSSSLVPPLSTAPISQSIGSDTTQEQKDPIDALRGPTQPFFMATSHHQTPPPPLPLPSLVLGGLSRDVGDPVWSGGQASRGGEEWQRVEGGESRGRERERIHSEVNLQQLVFSLESKVHSLTETVRELSRRLHYFEQASLERDRQLDHLHRTVIYQQQQSPPSAGAISGGGTHYFAPRPSTDSTTYYDLPTPPPTSNLHEFTFMEQARTTPSGSHRRTASTPSATIQRSDSFHHPQLAYATSSASSSAAIAAEQFYYPQSSETPPSRTYPSTPQRQSSISPSEPLYSRRINPHHVASPVPLVGGGGTPFVGRRPTMSHGRTLSASTTSSNLTGDGGGSWAFPSPSSPSTTTTSRSSAELFRSSSMDSGSSASIASFESLSLVGAGTGAGAGEGVGSLGGTMMMNTVVRPLREDGYNYRGLLENDSDIDEDIFVRRVFLQNDQQCSLFLQQRVKTTCTMEKKQRLLESVAKYLFDLSTSKFGNFLVSRCIESADAGIVQLYSQRFVGHFLQLSLDPFGCHVVQKLLDRCDGSTKEQVINELSPFPNTLLQKPSLHVWNRLLSQPNPPEFYQRLAEMGKTTWSRIVMEEGGSLLVQHMLEDWNSEVHGSIVARELLEGLEEVAMTACGSFVLVAFIDRNFLPFRTRVMELASKLAIDTFGANILERVLKLSKVSSELLSQFIQEITSTREDEEQPPLLLTIASHASGSNLISHLISSSIAPYPDKSKLVRCIAKNSQRLVDEGGIHAAKLLTLIGGGGGQG
ncbi:uncharacterized protein JCM6883_006486 [Sporobolomyces salmoneus]|uniref:uncharacterized protein n=1 Tax=Sporobolomyces salmoneus TaxID=183962 RepID=UPI00317DE834